MPLTRHDEDPESLNISSKFLLTCLLRGMTMAKGTLNAGSEVSTHMPLTRHDDMTDEERRALQVSTHMPLTRHDRGAEDV